MNAQELLDSLATKTVLVIGDSIIDVNTYLEKINPLDDATPVYRKILNERDQGDEYSLGGAGLVVRNLLELGAKVDFITSIGYGAGALHAQRELKRKNLTLHAVQVAKPQTVKHRFWCGGKKVLGVDTVDNAPVTAEEQDTLTRMYDLCGGIYTKSHDAIVVSDYRHGLITETFANHIVRAHHPEIPVYVASQISQSETNHHWYMGDCCFVLNEYEARAVMVLGGRFSCGRWFHTAGAFGASYQDARPLHRLTDFKKAIAVDVVDTCGAGDAFMAAAALTNDLQFANIWAGLSCTVNGANPPTRQMLIDWCPAHES